MIARSSGLCGSALRLVYVNKLVNISAGRKYRLRALNFANGASILLASTAVKNASDSHIFGMIISEGSLPAFAELFERYWQRLYVKAYARLESEADAKDCVQEVFMTIWTRRESLAMPLSVAAYLHTAVRNRVFNLFHARMTDQKHLLAYAHETQFHDEPDNHSAGFEELALLIEKEIAYMPEQMRRIYLLSREQHMTGVQIAEHLALSHQTVRNQISNALRRIKERVERYRNS